jgi:hypothetical protein
MFRLSSGKRQQSLGDENPARHQRLPCEERATRVEVSRWISVPEIGLEVRYDVIDAGQPAAGGRREAVRLVFQGKRFLGFSWGPLGDRGV